MIFVGHPTPTETVELVHMTQHAVGRVSQRAHMVLRSSRQSAVPEIADIFTVHPTTVRTWLNRFTTQGPDGRYDSPCSGRPAKATPVVRATLTQVVGDDPIHAGYRATVWTVAMLGAVLALHLGIQMASTTLRHVLHGLGLAWGRPRRAMPGKTDPEKAAKQWAMAWAVVSAPPGTPIRYGDERHLEPLPVIRAAWHGLGQQIHVPTPGTNKQRPILGAVDIDTGQWVHLIRDRATKEDVRVFLAYLLTVFSEGPIVLVVDN